MRYDDQLKVSLTVNKARVEPRMHGADYLLQLSDFARRFWMPCWKMLGVASSSSKAMWILGSSDSVNTLNWLKSTALSGSICGSM